MRRFFLAFFVLGLLAWGLPASAQQNCFGPSCSVRGAGTPVPGCNAITAIANVANGSFACNPASVVNGTVTTAGRSIVTIRDTIGGASITDNFLTIQGAFTGSASTTQYAFNATVASTGSASFNQILALFNLQAGYTGSSSTATVSAINAAAGTNTTGGAGNAAVAAAANATTSGFNYGVRGGALGSSAQNIGVQGMAANSTNTPTQNIGVIGLSGSATNNVAGYFLLGTVPAGAAPTGNAAVLGDNGSTGLDIFLGRVNNVDVERLMGTGARWSKMQTKNLTLGGGAVTFVRIAVTSNSFQGGFIEYCADANDATDYQTRCGIVPFSIVNKGGTETCTVATTGAATESVAVSVGTFTVAFTTDTATPTNGCDFQANGTSSLTETVMRINYSVRLVGNAATTVTPQ